MVDSQPSCLQFFVLNMLYSSGPRRVAFWLRKRSGPFLLYKKCLFFVSSFCSFFDVDRMVGCIPILYFGSTIIMYLFSLSRVSNFSCILVVSMQRFAESQCSWDNLSCAGLFAWCRCEHLRWRTEITTGSRFRQSVWLPRSFHLFRTRLHPQQRLDLVLWSVAMAWLLNLRRLPSSSLEEL